MPNRKTIVFWWRLPRVFRGWNQRALFLLVGDGPLQPAIEALVRERGLSTNFIFLGVRDDVQRLMLGAMDCFLFPSSYEGLGLVLWEAQAAGLTCVISDTIPDEASVATKLVRRLSLAQDQRRGRMNYSAFVAVAGRSRDPLPAEIFQLHNRSLSGRAYPHLRLVPARRLRRQQKSPCLSHRMAWKQLSYFLELSSKHEFSF